jgi:CheY-like chemotaxis protein
METFAALPHSTSPARDPRIGVLLADDDDRMRSLLATSASNAIQGIVVLEAKDGAEAVQLGLQQRPRIALLDINMPRLGGFEVATTLRELQPRMRLALQTGDPDAHRERARAHRLPLFDKRELVRALSWVEAQAEALADSQAGPRLAQTHNLECSSCGYGISCRTPPERCPMCYGEDGWTHGAWRPFARAAPTV